MTVLLLMAAAVALWSVYFCFRWHQSSWVFRGGEKLSRTGRQLAVALVFALVSVIWISDDLAMCVGRSGCSDDFLDALVGRKLSLSVVLSYAFALAALSEVLLLARRRPD